MKEFKGKVSMCSEHPSHWNKEGFVPTQADYEALEWRELSGVINAQFNKKEPLIPFNAMSEKAK